MNTVLIVGGGLCVVLALVLALTRYRQTSEISRSVQHLTGRQRRELMRHFLGGSQVPGDLSAEAIGLARLYRSQDVSALLNVGLVIGLIGQVVGPLKDDGALRLLVIVAAAAGLIGTGLAARQYVAGRRFLNRRELATG